MTTTVEISRAIGPADHDWELTIEISGGFERPSRDYPGHEPDVELVSAYCEETGEAVDEDVEEWLTAQGVDVDEVRCEALESVE